MKIALLVPEMNVGGVEQGTFDLAKGFVERGHTVFLLSAGGKMLSSLEKSGVKIIYFSFNKKNPFSFFLSLIKLKNLIKKEKINIVHARSRFPAWVAYFVCKNLRNVHFITSIHGFYKKKFYSRIMVKGERIIDVSNSLKNYGIEFLKGDKSKFRIIYNGIDFTPFENVKKQNHSGFVIGMIGRFTKIKGYQYVLYACEKLKNQIPELKILLVGEGSYRTVLEKIAEKCKINVEFKKGKSCEFLPLIDVLIAPHENPEPLYENQSIWIGRAAVEAQFCGIPVITTMENLQKGDVFKGKTAIYVPPKDIETLSKAIFYVYKNYKNLKDIIENAKISVKENFSVDKMVEETLKVYEELL